MTRKINDAGLELIKQHEGCRLMAYVDIAGIWTIGYGHVKGVYPAMQITQEEADQALADDLAGAEHAVNGATTGVSTSDNQFAAMVSLCFNIGATKFRRSSVLRAHRAGQVAVAADEFLEWNKVHIGSQFREIEELTERRRAERKLYLSES